MKKSEMAYGGAEYISEHGHTKKNYFEGSSGDTFEQSAEKGAAACMLGGMIGFGIRQGMGQGVAFGMANDVETEFFRLRGQALPGLNDRDETSKEDAILALKELGKELEEKGE